MSRTRVTIGLALLLAAFLVLPFHLSNSNPRAEHQVVTSSSGGNDAAEQASRTPLIVYIAGQDTLSAALRQDLTARLESSSHFALVTVSQNQPKLDEFPALVVEIAERNLLWTPVFARGRLRLRFSYASDKGDISPRDTGPAIFDGSPAIRVHGDINLTDQTIGLVSRPGYSSVLGRTLANQAVVQLEQALQGSPS